MDDNGAPPLDEGYQRRSISAEPGRGQRRHGLYAASESALTVRAIRVRRIVARMRKELPWLTAADVPAMRGWAELEILSSTVFAILTKINVINGEGEPRRLLSEHRQLKLAQLAYERELGMTPAARMAIKANGTRAALDLAAAMAAEEVEGDGDPRPD
ncbi:MAG: hypothetical protein ABSD31_19750 [Candidatus Binataceae bacterium]